MPKVVAKATTKATVVAKATTKATVVAKATTTKRSRSHGGGARRTARCFDDASTKPKTARPHHRKSRHRAYNIRVEDEEQVYDTRDAVDLAEEEQRLEEDEWNDDDDGGLEAVAWKDDDGGLDHSGWQAAGEEWKSDDGGAWTEDDDGGC